MHHKVSNTPPGAVKDQLVGFPKKFNVAVWLVAQLQQGAQVVVELVLGRLILVAGWHHRFVHADQCRCQIQRIPLQWEKLNHQKVLDDQDNLGASVIRESKRVDLEVSSNAS
jgi:hypothetical protein